MYKQPEIHNLAKRRVRRKARFYKHFFFFIVFNGFLFVRSVLEGNLFDDSMTITFLWGIGLAFHYLRVFGMPGKGVLSAEWEEKEYRRELEQLEERENGKKTTRLQLEEELELKEMTKRYRDSDLV